MKSYTHQTLITQMEKWAPKHLAYDWDPVGLQIGNPKDKTNKVMVTLDVTEQVVDEAIDHHVNLIIAHHPLLFKPIQQIATTSFKGKVLEKLFKHDITVYAAHTNLDVANGGVNDLISEALGMEKVQPLIKTATDQLYKLMVYVPKDHVEEMRNALSEKGAGHIGDYSHCTFQTEGTGTFKPLEGTNPFIGTKNQLEFVPEKKLETIVREQDMSAILNEMKRVHPYEEVAYDLFKVEQSGETYGLGRIGYVKEEMTLEQFCNVVKDSLNIPHLRFVGEKNKTIRKIAVLGGSGEKFINAALQQKADVYVTGDVTFHPAQDALESGLSIIDAGHYIEKIMKKATSEYLTNQLPDVNVIISTTNTDPFQFG